MAAHEINFDGIVGPTHNYAGLAAGNLAAQKSRSTVSDPRAAALEGLAKMKLLAGLGVRQAVLPPQERPDVTALRRIGFAGSDAAVIEQAYRSDPAMLAACSSASSMWAANAATVSPSADTSDHRVHVTPANLVSHFHRSLETDATAAMLRSIFAGDEHFVHHAPLPAAASACDEGAANHTRLATAFDTAGVEIFAFGRWHGGERRTMIFEGRQTFEASSAITRLHRLHPNRTLLIEQNPRAIDAGVFHNDVIAVGHLNVLLCHELAFADAKAIETISRAFESVCGERLHTVVASEDELTIAEAVETYLFNSQIVSLADGSMAVIAPIESEIRPASRRFIDRILESDNPIRSVHFVDVRQSMQNGGGPACLRLRVALNDAEIAACKPAVFLTDTLYDTLTAWVNRHYRSRLSADDLGDPKLLDESRAALDELSRILDLGSIYPFQK